MLKHRFFALVFLLLALSPNALAGKVYKWTDEQGRVHFGTQPPAVQQSDVVGENEDEVLAGSVTRGATDSVSAEQLKGYWRGTRLGRQIKLVFDGKNRFIETVNYREAPQSPRFKRSYGGYWTQKRKRIYFTIKYEDQGAWRIPPMKFVDVIKLEGNTLTVVWDKEPEVLVKQFRTSFPAIPDEY